MCLFSTEMQHSVISTGKKRLLKQKNSEGEMYSFNWHHTEPFVKILSLLITRTKDANLRNSQCSCLHTLIQSLTLHTYGWLAITKQKDKFFPKFFHVHWHFYNPSIAVSYLFSHGFNLYKPNGLANCQSWLAVWQAQLVTHTSKWKNTNTL